jgi:hypothetical protein
MPPPVAIFLGVLVAPALSPTPTRILWMAPQMRVFFVVAQSASGQDFPTLCTIWHQQGHFGMILRLFPDHLVTPEAKIRQLCARLIAAENDEAAERIL